MGSKGLSRRHSKGLSRRQLLKALALLPFAGVGLRLAADSLARATAVGPRPNIVVLVFDTLSAAHVPLHGYPRMTMPNLVTAAERATVFHAHHSAGNFTTPGTASLLTGAYPWAHRALHLQGTVTEAFADRSLFSALREAGYHGLAYTHNIVATSLLDQFRGDVEILPPIDQLALAEFNYSENLVPNDFVAATHAEGILTRRGDAFSSSLLLYQVRQWLEGRRMFQLEQQYRDQFPRGLPGQHNQRFLLEEAIDWTIEQLATMPQPLFAYLHYLPPHDPYHPRHEFVGMFEDGWKPAQKPTHPLADGEVPWDSLLQLRRDYDEHIAYVDAEMARLLDYLERSGLSESTYVILTSDHGELFERGIWQHVTPVMFEPVLRVPLVIWKPGQATRQDVMQPTAGVDIAPTVLRLAGQPIPAWCEGEVLPTIVDGEAPTADRDVYAVEAKMSPKHGRLPIRSTSLTRGRYKLTHYLGYAGYDDVYELYDLNDDPEELNDIFATRTDVAADLVAEMTARWAAVEANS